MNDSLQSEFGIRFSQTGKVPCRLFSWRPILSLAVAACFVMTVPVARADVIGEGDVLPVGPTDLPIGGGISVDVIVGDTAPGILSIDIPASTDPLISPTGIIGNMATGIGEATVSGFAADQSEWTVETTLTVASAGQGYLNVTGGGLVSVGDNTTDPGVFTLGEIIVGDLLNSYGNVFVDGFVSTLETFNLTVADEGVGIVEIRNRGQLRTQMATIGLEDTSIGTLTLTGPGTRWTNYDDGSEGMVIGENGRGTLEIYSGAIAFTAGDAVISNSTGSRGTVLVSGSGALWQVGDDSGTDNLSIGVGATAELRIDFGGMVRVDDATTVGVNSLVELNDGTLNSGSLNNNGIIIGDGRIESGITISTTGELRNAAASASIREKLLVTGPVTNDGRIESLGGEMQFESTVTNNASGDIIGRDAVFRFSGGLVNNGSLFFGGDTTVYGDVSTGFLEILAGGTTLIDGSLSLSGALAMTIGLESSYLEVTDTASLDGPIVIEFGQGYVPVVGDAFELISASILSISPGSVPALIMPDDGGLLWTFDDPTTDDRLILRAQVGFTPLLGDFDLDEDVDGADFLSWQRGFGTLYDATDLANWEASFGTTPAVAAITAVPEPSALALLMVGAMGLVSLVRRADCGIPH